MNKLNYGYLIYFCFFKMELIQKVKELYSEMNWKLTSTLVSIPVISEFVIDGLICSHKSAFDDHADYFQTGFETILMLGIGIYKSHMDALKIKTEKKLQKSEKNYKRLVKNIPSIVYKGYKDWSIDLFDNKIEVLTGYDIKEFHSKKKKLSDLIVKDDYEKAKNVFIKALKSDRSYVREYRIATKGGDIKWIHERGHIVFDDKREIDYISGIIYDNTEIKYMKDKLEKISITDSLTGLYNRRQFDKILNEETNRVNRTRRFDIPLSLIMIDIDNFKNYNDIYGHPEADKVLNYFGEKVISSNIRDVDFGFRYGGEEFAVLLPETITDHAMVIADRIRKKLKAYNFTPDSKKSVNVTISLGITKYIRDESVDSFIKRADSALYMAKDKGRDMSYLI